MGFITSYDKMDTYSIYPNPQSTETSQNPSRTPTRQSSVSSSSSKNSLSSLQQALQSYPAAAAAATNTSTSTSTTTTAPASHTKFPSAAHPIDPLSRDYPKPTEELNVREALDRKPRKWTLAHYIKETPVLDFEEAREKDRERIAREREERKQELLHAKEELRRMSLPK